MALHRAIAEALFAHPLWVALVHVGASGSGARRRRRAHHAPTAPGVYFGARGLGGVYFINGYFK